MRKLKDYIEARFKFFSILTVIVYALLGAGSIWYIVKHINFNYELEGFFPKGTDELAFYLEHVERFESDHDVILVSVTNEKGIFKKDFLQNLKASVDSVSAFPEVTGVVDPFKMVRLVYAEPSPVTRPFLHASDPSQYEKDSIRLAGTKHFAKNFISFSSSSLCYIVKVKNNLGVDSSKALVKKVMAYLDTFHFDKVRLSGRIKSQTYIVSKMESEFILLASITAVMLLVFLYFTFRNFWGIVLPFLVVLIGMLFTLSCILAISGSLNLISVILPTVLFVVGVSDAVHVLNSYYTELNNGHSKLKSIKLTVYEIGRATFLTAITSAIGFFTLITVKVSIIADFGVFAAIGIMIIYVISFTFLIAMLFLVKPFYLPQQKEFIKYAPFEKLFVHVLRWRKWVAAGFILAIFPLIYGVTQINVNNFFTEEFAKNDPHKKDFDFFDQYFGGVRPYEISIKVKKPKKNIFDYEVVKQLDKIEKYLADSLHVGGLVSSNTPVKMANQMIHKGADDAFVIAENDSLHSVDTALVLKFASEFHNALVTADLKWGRVSGRLPDIGAIEARRLNAKLHHFARNNIDSNLVDYKITGLSEIIDGNVRYLTSNMMDGLVYELLAIGVLMGLLFRSFRMMLLSLVPNVFPLLFVGGIMGLLGINLNVSSSIIFSIAFGITVDDTIHLLGRYKLELKKGFDNRTALRNAYVHSGKAVTMTSVILFSGFSILMLSSFNGIFNTGLLVGMTLFVAVFSDLMLLPVLFGSDKKRKQEEDKKTKPQNASNGL